MSIKKLFEEIKNYNSSLEGTWKIDSRKIDLEEFLDDILEYFEINGEFKDRLDEEFDYPNNKDYHGQKNAHLNYIIWFLHHVKPFLLLSYKLAWNRDIEKALKESKLSEEAIENMLYNFVNIYRHGRNPIYYPGVYEEFQEFKKEFKNVIEYYKEIENFDGKTTGSIRDFAKAIKKYGLTKQILSNYLFKMKRFEKDCSRATKYRFDKDVILVEDSKYTIKDALEKFDFYEGALK